MRLPMPKVQCDEFGVCDGWLVCRHVREGGANIAHTEAPTTRAYGVAVCAVCAAAMANADSGRLAELRFMMPLMCAGCVDVLRKETAGSGPHEFRNN